MSKSHPSPAARRLTLAAALSLFAALLLASTALAAFFNISISDDSIADWAGAPVLHEDGIEPSVPAETDIIRTYMVRDAALSRYYFRTTMEGVGVDLAIVTAHLDCTDDGDVEDPEDVNITFFPGEYFTGEFDVVSINRGDFSGEPYEYPNGGQVVVNGPDVDYEWAGIILGSPLGASNCVSNIDIGVSFESSIGFDFDYTALALWNVPTAVELQDFAARPQVAPLTAAALLALAGLLALGSFVIVRRKI